MKFNAIVFAAAAGIALTAVGVPRASASPTAAPSAHLSANSGAQLWAKLYDNRGNGGALSVAASANGSAVFVTGYVTTAAGTERWATVAYNAATGARRWVQRYDGEGGARAFSLAVSRTTGTVFVTGYSGESGDYATIAYKG